MSIVMVRVAICFCSSELHFTFNKNLMDSAFEREEGSLIHLKDDGLILKRNETPTVIDGSQPFCCL